VHPDTAPGALVGVVLCGGASRRMGRDKALVPVGGVPMAQRVADALRHAGCEPVVVVGGDGAALRDLGMQVVPDLHPGEGPLGGLITALRSFAHASAVVVVACDLPWLGAGSISSVVAAMAPQVEAAVGRTDRVQPLVGAWRPSALPLLEAAFAAGERRLRAVLHDLHAAMVDLPEAELANVNTPDDLRQ